MPGEPDPLYVRARAALLDALTALQPHLDAVVPVGAQAIYMHTGDADLAVAEYTTDADLSVSPDDLADSPLLGDLFSTSGFTPREHPGGWLSPDGISIDVMVCRGARRSRHTRRPARCPRQARCQAGEGTRRRARGIASGPSSPRSIAPTPEQLRCGLPGLWCAARLKGPQDRRTCRSEGSGSRQGRARHPATPACDRHRRAGQSAGTPAGVEPGWRGHQQGHRIAAQTLWRPLRRRRGNGRSRRR